MVLHAKHHALLNPIVIQLWLAKHVQVHAILAVARHQTAPPVQMAITLRQEEFVKTPQYSSVSTISSAQGSVQQLHVSSFFSSYAAARPNWSRQQSPLFLYQRYYPGVASSISTTLSLPSSTSWHSVLLLGSMLSWISSIVWFTKRWSFTKAAFNTKNWSSSTTVGTLSRCAHLSSFLSSSTSSRCLISWTRLR